MDTQEQASSFADVESRFSAALERMEHAQMAVQKKEELVHMERKEVEKERLQNQVQSLVRDNLKLQVLKGAWVDLLVCTHEVVYNAVHMTVQSCGLH